MNTSPLFQLFILEDNDSLRSDLTKILMAAFPGLAVIEASCIDEGLEAIAHSIPPTLAILDVRVPMKRGIPPQEAYPHVADRLRDMGVPCIFMTAFKDLPDVEDYLRKRSLVDPLAVVVEKSLNCGQLTSELKQHARVLFERRATSTVLAALNSIFKPVQSDEQSGTASLIHSQRVIQAYWAYLNDDTKNKVRAHFAIHEQQNGQLTISLFTEGRSL